MTSSCYLLKLYLNSNNFTRGYTCSLRNIWKYCICLTFFKKKQRVGGELSSNLCLPLASPIYFKVDGRNWYSLPLFSSQPTIIWLLSIPQPQIAFCSHQITSTWQTEWVFSQPHLTGPPRIIWLWKLLLSWNSPWLFWHPLGSRSSSLTTFSGAITNSSPFGAAL